MGLPEVTAAGPVFNTVDPDCDPTIVVTGGAVTGGRPGSDGVTVAVLLSVPVIFEAIVPDTIIRTILPELRSAITEISLPVPLAPVWIVAVPVVTVAAQLTPVMPAGTTSVMAVPTLFDGPILLVVIV